MRLAGDGEIDRDVELVRRQLAGQRRLAVPVHDPLPLMQVIGEVEQDDFVENSKTLRQRRIGRTEQADESRVGQDLAETQQRRDGYDHVAQLIRAKNGDILDLAGEGMGRGAVDDARPGVDLLDHGQRRILVERRNKAVAVDECIGRQRLRNDEALAAPVGPLPGVAAHVDRPEHQLVPPQWEIREINPGVVDVFHDVWIGFFPPLRRHDEVTLVYEFPIEEDLDVQIGRCRYDIAA